MRTESRTTLRTIAVAVLLLAIVTAAGGCASGGKPAPTASPDDPAGRETCFANQRTAQGEALQWMGRSGRPIVGMTPEALKKGGAISEVPVCPAGGDFIFNPNDASFTCTIHGWAPD